MVPGSPPETSTGKTEEWNGTNWTESADLSTARWSLYSSSSSSSSATASAGENLPAISNSTEEWLAAGTALTRTFTDS